MKILILNWRDIKNPQSGGAEILTHEIGKRFVKEGHEVLYISSKFKNAKNEEVIDGICVKRVGHPDARYVFWSLHFKFILLYFLKLRGKFDVLIEEIHGVPFFTPLFVKEKKIILICEVASNLWDIAVSFPFNKFGKILENFYPRFYKNLNWITISPSTKKELIKKEIPEKNISIIPMGSDVPVLNKIPKKNKELNLIFLARIGKQKGIEDALEAVSILRNRFPSLKLHVLGRGNFQYIRFLRKKVKKLKINKNIRFYGFVSQSEKFKMLSKCHLLIAPSFKEGWGLTVHEAGARGTPSVVYDVEGLRDVVKNRINGIVCEKNDPKGLAEAVVSIYENKDLYVKIQKKILEETKKLNWHVTYIELIKILKK